MKNLRKIIALFAFIFIGGVVITVVTVNSTLNTQKSEQELIEVQRDTTYLLKAEKKTKAI